MSEFQISRKREPFLNRLGVLCLCMAAALTLMAQGFLGYGVDTNIVNTQTANYSIAASDCTKTIQAGTGSTGAFTLTLPAVTGFPTNCSILIKNGDTAASKTLSGFPADLSATLAASQSVGVKIVNGAWASFYSPSPVLSLPAGIDQNILNTQTANYSIASTDCGKTIQVGTGSTGQFTLTLPSISGFPTTCSVFVKNGDSTNGKILSGFPADVGTKLYPQQSFGVKVINGAWATAYAPTVWSPAGGLNLFVSTTGNDNNDCLTSGTACTLATVCGGNGNTLRSQYIKTGIFQINVADGTYSTLDPTPALCSFVGDGSTSGTVLVFLVGNCTTPANVIMSIPAGGSGVFLKDYGNAEVECMSFTGAGGSVEIGVSLAQFAILDLIKTVWGSFGAGSVGIILGQSASLNLDGAATATINAGISTFLSSNSNATVSAGGSTTIVIPSAVAWGSQFFQAFGAGTTSLGGVTFTGAGVAGTTGKRATLIGPGYLSTGGIGVNTFFPGSVAATLISGFQDDAGDNPTTVTPSGGLTCPPGFPSGSFSTSNGIVNHC